MIFFLTALIPVNLTLINNSWNLLRAACVHRESFLQGFRKLTSLWDQTLEHRKFEFGFKNKYFHPFEFYFIPYSIKIYIIEKSSFTCKTKTGNEIRKLNSINL